MLSGWLEEKKLKIMKFGSVERPDDNVYRLKGLIRVCDGRKMDERLAREFAGMIHELELVKYQCSFGLCCWGNFYRAHALTMIFFCNDNKAGFFCPK
ncbi:hypothetical protein D3C73_769210 [compost metagenome]